MTTIMTVDDYYDYDYDNTTTQHDVSADDTTTTCDAKHDNAPCDNSMTMQ